MWCFQVVFCEHKLFIRLATGLVFLVGASDSYGRWFESQHRILDGCVLRLICPKNL